MKQINLWQSFDQAALWMKSDRIVSEGRPRQYWGEYSKDMAMVTHSLAVNEASLLLQDLLQVTVTKVCTSRQTWYTTYHMYVYHMWYSTYHMWMQQAIVFCNFHRSGGGEGALARPSEAFTFPSHPPTHSRAPQSRFLPPPQKLGRLLGKHFFHIVGKECVVQHWKTETVIMSFRFYKMKKLVNILHQARLALKVLPVPSFHCWIIFFSNL